MKLTVLNDTVLKTSVQQSSELPPEDLAPLKAGLELPVLAYRPTDAGHVIITLDPNEIDLRSLHPSGKNTWFVFDAHLEDPEGMGPNNNPKDKPARKLKTGKELKFPGFSGTYNTNDPIHAGGNFTWGEATHGGSRIPEAPHVVENIKRIADVMQTVRHKLGDRAITPTSWYRDPSTNRRVGGASQSRHLQGDAIDFYVDGLTPWGMYERLDGWHGSKGGLAAGVGFLHLDLRGYRARWRYPGA